jgi:drug/metabolite transporter (DMT)-like permease
MKLSTKANLYLLLITVIWGATFPIIRNALVHVNPSLFVAVRFAIAALFMLPIIWKSLKNTSGTLLLQSFLFGLSNGVGYITQTIGLQTTSSSRAAFITGFSVVLVPFMAPFFRLGRIQPTDILYSLICLTGLYFLTGAQFALITRGDIWLFMCAIAFAIQISYMQKLSVKISDYRLLTFYQLLFTVPMAFAFSVNSNYQTLLYPSVIFALLFCAYVATMLVYLIQTKYQQFTTAPKAALIFALEPVFASIFGFIINHEPITMHTLLGGSLILLSLCIPSLKWLKKYTTANLANS